MKRIGVFLVILCSFLYVRGDVPVEIVAGNEDDGIPSLPLNLTVWFRGSWEIAEGSPVPAHLDHRTGSLLLNLRDLEMSRETGELDPFYSLESDLSHVNGCVPIEGELVLRNGIYLSDSSSIYPLLGLYCESHDSFAVVGFPVALLNALFRKEAGKELRNNTVLRIRNILANIYGEFEPYRAEMPERKPDDDATMCLLELGFSVGKGIHPDVGAFVELNGTGKADDCAVPYVFNMMNVVPFRIEDFLPWILGYSITMVGAGLLQLYAFFLQYRYTNSMPGGAIRLSAVTLGWLGFLDVASVFGHLGVAILLESQSAFNLFGLISLIKFVLFAWFESRLFFLSCKAQVAARDPDEEISSAMRRRLVSLYIRFYILLLIFAYLTWNVHGFYRFTALVVSSFWIPQIYHNARKRVLFAYRHVSIVLISLSYLILPCYFLGYGGEVGMVETQPSLCLLICSYVALQAGILILQDKFGPLFFIPRKYRPVQPMPFDYYVVPEEPAGECSICLGLVQDDPEIVTDVENGRGPVMTTPCGHTFHSACLIRWMTQRLECPVCRAVLPPP